MFEDFKEVMSEFAKTIGERFLNKMKLNAQKRNKDNHDLEVKYEHLEELYELEDEYQAKLNEKDLEKHKFIYKLELEHVRHEIKLLKLEIKDLERKNRMDEDEKEFESLTNYQRWEEDIRHRKELERIEQEATQEFNRVNEGHLIKRRKKELKEIKIKLAHELEELNQRIAKEEKEFKIQELDQKRRDELELKTQAEESRHNIEVLKEQLEFLKSQHDISEKQQKEINKLELLKQNEESRFLLLKLQREVEKFKIENKITEEDEKLIYEKLKNILKNRKIDTTTELEKMLHETNLRLEELKFLKQMNRLSLGQQQELYKLELEKQGLEFAHALTLVRERNDFILKGFNIDEDQVKENNIIQLLRKREFNFNDKTSIIGELLGHSKDLLYAVSLFKHINNSLYNDKEFMERAIKIRSELLQFASDDLKNNREFIKNIIEYNPDIINYVDLSTQNDVDLVYGLLQNTDKKYELLKSSSYRVRTNDKILDYVLKYDTRCLEFITPEYHNAKDAIVNILKEDNTLIKYLTYDTAKALNLGENRDFAMVCLKGNYIEYKDLIADKFKGDIKVAKEVIGKNNDTIVWFNEIVLNNEEIMMNLIDSDVNNIVYIGNKLLCKEELMRKVVKENGLENDFNFAERLLRMRGQYLKLFSYGIKKDKKLVLIALSNAGNEIKDDIAPELLLDNEISEYVSKLDVNNVKKLKLFQSIENNGYSGWKRELELENPYAKDFQALKKVVDKIDNEDEAYDMYLTLNNPKNNITFYTENPNNKDILNNLLVKYITDEKYKEKMGYKNSSIPLNRFFDLLSYIIETDDIGALEKYEGDKVEIYKTVNYATHQPDDIGFWYGEIRGYARYNSGDYKYVRVDFDKMRILQAFVEIYGYDKIVNYLKGEEKVIRQLVDFNYGFEKDNKSRKAS